MDYPVSHQPSMTSTQHHKHKTITNNNFTIDENGIPTTVSNKTLMIGMVRVEVGDIWEPPTPKMGGQKMQDQKKHDQKKNNSWKLMEWKMQDQTLGKVRRWEIQLS